MRKYSSIILLFILLFNMVGYRAWFYYAEQKWDASLESRLDNDLYNESELVSLSVPLCNPYQSEQTAFERVSGEINFQGKTYKFVKRRISDGNLVLLCIPDIRKMVLKKAKSDYGNDVNDLASNSKNPSRSGTQKSFNCSDYVDQFPNFQISKFPNLQIVYSPVQVYGFSDRHIAAPAKPPQFRA